MMAELKNTELTNRRRMLSFMSKDARCVRVSFTYVVFSYGYFDRKESVLMNKFVLEWKLLMLRSNLIYLYLIRDQPAFKQRFLFIPDDRPWWWFIGYRFNDSTGQEF